MQPVASTTAVNEMPARDPASAGGSANKAPTPRASSAQGHEPQVLQPWGQGVLYQQRNAQGQYEVRWRADDPARYRQSDLPVFESARAVNLQRDATRRLADSSIPGVSNPFRTVGSPLYNAMNKVLERAEDPSNRIETPAGNTPASSSPLESAARFAHGVMRGLSLDNVEGLARLAPYLPSGNGTVIPLPITPEAQRGIDLTRGIQASTSRQVGDAVAQFNDGVSRTVGFAPDSPEVSAGRTAAVVAQLAEGAYGAARGALSLARGGGAVRAAATDIEAVERAGLSIGATPGASGGGARTNALWAQIQLADRQQAAAIGELLRGSRYRGVDAVALAEKNGTTALAAARELAGQTIDLDRTVLPRASRQALTGARIKVIQSRSFDALIDRFETQIAQHPDKSMLGGEEVLRLAQPARDDSVPTGVYNMIFNGQQGTHVHPGPRWLTIFTGEQAAAVRLAGPLNDDALLNSSARSLRLGDRVVPSAQINFPPNSKIVLEMDAGVIHGFEGRFAAVSTHWTDKADALRLGLDAGAVYGKDSMSAFTKMINPANVGAPDNVTIDQASPHMGELRRGAGTRQSAR
jgi:hypothetical protein